MTNTENTAQAANIPKIVNQVSRVVFAALVIMVSHIRDNACKNSDIYVSPPSVYRWTLTEYVIHGILIISDLL